jgi:hypothetical protein
MSGVIAVPGDEDDDTSDTDDRRPELKAGPDEVEEDATGNEEQDEEEKERERNLDHLWGDEGEFDSGSGEEWDPKEWGR